MQLPAGRSYRIVRIQLPFPCLRNRSENALTVSLVRLLLYFVDVAQIRCVVFQGRSYHCARSEETTSPIGPVPRCPSRDSFRTHFDPTKPASKSSIRSYAPESRSDRVNVGFIHVGWGGYGCGIHHCRSDFWGSMNDSMFEIAAFV